MSAWHRRSGLTGDWQRHYPTARRIAAALLADPALLALRTRRLQSDVRQRFDVSRGTAMAAIGTARAAAKREDIAPAPVHVDPDSSPERSRSGFCSRCDACHGRPNSAYCRSCHAAYTREWRKAHSLTPAQRKKDNARSQAAVALKRGKIVRQPCELCGEHAEMHHDDYDKPTDVRWLCRPCHLAHHQAERNA